MVCNGEDGIENEVAEGRGDKDQGRGSCEKSRSDLQRV